VKSLLVTKVGNPAGEIEQAGLFQVNREANAKVIRKAMRNEPSIDWLRENQASITHYFHQLGLEGTI
jgi:formaldehyde-activating enzyme involved in methanogenesis